MAVRLPVRAILPQPPTTPLKGLARIFSRGANVAEFPDAIENP